MSAQIVPIRPGIAWAPDTRTKRQKSIDDRFMAYVIAQSGMDQFRRSPIGSPAQRALRYRLIVMSCRFASNNHDWLKASDKLPDLDVVAERLLAHNERQLQRNMCEVG
jgi:hypothetical protein